MFTGPITDPDTRKVATNMVEEFERALRRWQEARKSAGERGHSEQLAQCDQKIAYIEAQTAEIRKALEPPAKG